VHQSHTINAVARQVQPLQQANVQTRAAFATTQAGISVYALTGQKAYVSLHRQQRGLCRYWLGQLRQLGNPEYAGSIADQARSAQAWFKIADRIAAASGKSAARAVLSAGPPTVAFYASNDGLAQRPAVQGRELVADSSRSLATGLVWGGSLLLLAIGLALASSLRTIHTLTRPLHNLTSTLGRLTAGEYRARAEVAGPSEVRAVARSVNTLADEGDRLRRVDEQYSRLRAMARDAGNRIREHLNPEDVVREAHTAIQDQLGCDVVLLLLPIEGQAGDHQPQWALPGGGSSPVMPPDVTDWIRQVAERRASLVIQDLDQPVEDVALPQTVREGLCSRGVVTGMIVPLASGTDLLGVVSGWRTHGAAWTPAETDAFESIAGDVTRALRHARLYEAENRLIADLKALAQTRSDFLATVSHDLRTPLTSIVGFLELLRDGAEGPVTAGQSRMFDIIGRNARVLQNLIENVLAISTIELGVTKPVVYPVKLTETIGAALRSQEPAAETGKVALTCETPARPVIVKGDAAELDRVLLNLLSNAVKFTPPGGKVSVRLAEDDGFAVVRVADTGIGIPRADQEGLFTRFFRASNAVSRFVPGTGLGLSLCHAFVTEHGGTMYLDSHEGVGTTVTVRLPLHDGAGSAAIGPR
jgi:signal transduction histidine kinase